MLTASRAIAATNATGSRSTQGPSRLFAPAPPAALSAEPRSFGPSTVSVFPGGAKVATGYHVMIRHFPWSFCASARNDQAPSDFDVDCRRMGRPRPG